MHKTAALPDRIRARFPREENVGEQVACIYQLRDEDGNFAWLEHSLSNSIDVGALPIAPPEGIATFSVDEALQVFGSRENFFFVSQDVWVIGFPIGINVGGLPIWKKATIASEPRYSSAHNQHKILLDTATREGMSGAPVLYVNKSLTPATFDGRTQEVDLPSARVLLGIYSGRVAGDDELAAQIGIVWKAECIAEIIGNGRPYVQANNELFV